MLRRLNLKHQKKRHRARYGRKDQKKKARPAQVSSRESNVRHAIGGSCSLSYLLRKEYQNEEGYKWLRGYVWSNNDIFKAILEHPERISIRAHEFILKYYVTPGSMFNKRDKGAEADREVKEKVMPLCLYLHLPYYLEFTLSALYKLYIKLRDITLLKLCLKYSSREYIDQDPNKVMRYAGRRLKECTSREEQQQMRQIIDLLSTKFQTV